MLDLNEEGLKSEGGGKGFDSSKIFGFSVVEDNSIVRTLENVMISGFDHGASATGSAFFDIKLKDSNGNETNMREYDIDKTRGDWEKKQKSQLTRLKHIVTKFTPVGTALPAAATFPELWKGIEALLIVNQCNTKPMRLKLCYNDKGFLTVPKYVPFLEAMTVAAGDSKLSLNPGFDALERPSADKPSTVMTMTSANVTEDDGLPF